MHSRAASFTGSTTDTSGLLTRPLSAVRRGNILAKLNAVAVAVLEESHLIPQVIDRNNIQEAQPTSRRVVQARHLGMVLS